MQFIRRKPRHPPTVIIVALIDVLIVVLIFLMVTTTFKQQPALKLALPESSQPKEGAAETKLVVTIAKEPPYFYLGALPVVLDRLESELKAASAKNPKVSLAIRADTQAQFGQVVKVMDAAKAANIKAVSAFTKPDVKP